MGLVTVSVTVPEEKVPDLLRHAAGLYEEVTSTAGPGSEETDESTLPPALKRLVAQQRALHARAEARAPVDRETVQEAYLGGTSEKWRPFLVYLADRAGQWVKWQELLDAVNLTSAQGAGMIGAAERRCRMRPPYVKRSRSGLQEFKMPAEVAELIHEVAAEQ
jgi:hypothetical protein